MRFIITALVTYTILAPAILLSQEKKFVLKSHTTEEKLQTLDKEPTLFHVTEREITTSVKAQEVKESEKYLEVKRELSLLEFEYLGDIEPEEVIELKKFNSIPRIIEQLESFNNSTLNFTLKKNYLIEAQQLIAESNLTYLTYADDKINTRSAPAFSIIKKDPMDLKIHLKRIIWDLEKKAPIMLTEEVANNTESTSIPINVQKDIDSLRNELTTIQRYITVKNIDESYTRKVFMLQAKVSHTGSLTGTFVEVADSYYVMGYDYQKFKRNELISYSLMKKEGLTGKQMEFKEAKRLIRHTGTNEHYLVPSDFRVQFEYIETEPNPDVVEVAPRKPPVKSLPSQPASQPRSVVTYKQTSKFVKNPALSTTRADEPSAVYTKAIAASKTLTIKLENHREALLKGKMSSKRAVSWKNDIEQAEALQKKILALTNSSGKSIKQLSKTVNPQFVNNYNDFSKALNRAKQFSGY